MLPFMCDYMKLNLRARNKTNGELAKKSTLIKMAFRMRILVYLPVFAFDFSTFNFSLRHYLMISKQKCCFLLTGISTESQKRTSVLQIRLDSLQTRNIINMTRIILDLRRVI